MQLRLDHELPMGPGWTQYRYDAHDSVIKVNHWEAQLPVIPKSGYRMLSIARGEAAWEGTDADGNLVRLVPQGTQGISRIGINVSTPNPRRIMEFYVEAMEFDRVDDATVRCGDTLLFIERDSGGSETRDFIGPGFRYLTVQVFDADQAIMGIVARGGREARAAISFGNIARYGFVKDPDGNWIEISARASLTGIAPK